MTERKTARQIIDQVYVPDRLRETVKSIVNMAKSLDITVLAEGVEKQRQIEIRASPGIDLFQGYYYARPMSFEGATCFMRGRKRHNLPGEHAEVSTKLQALL